MTPTSGDKSADPREWMNRAKSDLLMAQTRSDPGVYLEDLCFHAQQAAEKALKALLIVRGIKFPYVHDLGNLLSLLEAHGEEIPESVDRASALTPYAATTRYPGIEEPTSDEEYEEMVAIAETVVGWVEGFIEQ